MLPDYRLTVSQVLETHFKKIEVGGVSADRRPIVDRRLVDSKLLPNPTDSRAIAKKKMVSYIFFPQADPKKQPKSLTVRRRPMGSMSPRFK